METKEMGFAEAMMQEQAEEVGATIISDDHGVPSFMIAVPRFNLEDFDPSLRAGPHPAFIRADGSLRENFFLSFDVASMWKDSVLCIPGRSPHVNVDYDEAKRLCFSKGKGWHMMTAWEWSAMAMWVIMQGRNPFKYSELEWIGGLKTVDGGLYYPNVNAINMPEEEWPFQGFYLDAKPNEDPVLSTRVTNYLGPHGSDDPENYGYVDWKDMESKQEYDALPEETRQRAMQIMVAPSKRLASKTSGTFYFRNYGTRFPRRGGYLNYGAGAGLAYLDLSSRRAGSYSAVGFRPAFSEESDI